MRFQGFFSYAHADADADSDLIEAFSVELEKRVSNRLVNATLLIWRDEHGIRLGERWNETIEDAIKASHLMIVLLSPKWVESEYCRKEYEFFTASEPEIGEYVAPLLVREISGQKIHFNPEQAAVVQEIEQRQYKRVLAADFRSLPKDERSLLVETIADDIGAMIERLRSLPEPTQVSGNRHPRRFSRPKEFSVKARNFEDVDFIDRPEIELQGTADEGCAILGQFDFVDRLYVQGTKGRIEFGVRRALLIVKNGSGGEIDRSQHLQKKHEHLRYVTLHDDRAALALSVDPPIGHRTLGELVLPPGPSAGENRLAEIGTIRKGQVANVQAEISVSLCVEGLTLTENITAPRTTAVQRAIEAIAAVAASKHEGAKDGKMTRKIRVRDKR